MLSVRTRHCEVRSNLFKLSQRLSYGDDWQLLPVMRRAYPKEIASYLAMTL
jgi:hypothetical protein